MGCTGAKGAGPAASSSKEAIMKARKTVADSLSEGMELVKKNCQNQMEQADMIIKVLDVMRHYQQCALKVPEGMDIFKCSLMGHVLQRDRKYKTNEHFAKSLQKILTPDQLMRAKDVKENMFDFSGLATRVKEVVDKMDDKDEGAAADSDDDDKATRSKFKRKKNKQEKETGPEKDRQDMLKLLTPVYELCEHMQNNLMEKSNITPEERDDMKNRIGYAAFAIKVFDFEKRGKEVKRAAFVGPESIGKSTVLNYIVSEGKGGQFMHTSSGMGTQIPCIISNAVQETLSLDGQQVSSAGGMGEMIKERSEKVKKQKLKDLNAFRATTAFNPPFELELIDVPGIKASTKLMSYITLSISSTIVLCLGKLESARTRLKDAGSLKLLVEIAQSLGRDVNLVCLITLEVKPGEFDPRPYQQLLKDFFPKARHPVKVIYANFVLLEDMHKRTETLNAFYGELKRHRSLPSDPHRIFHELSSQLNVFLQKVHKGLWDLLKNYTKEFDTALTDEVAPSLGGTTFTSDIVVKQELQKKKIHNHHRFNLSEDKKQFPCFSIGMNEKHVAQVKDDVLIAQELVFECRLAIMEWLGDIAMLLHNLVFGRHFEAITTMIAKADDEDDMERAQAAVCDRFCMISQGQVVEAKPNTITKRWWESQHANRVGQFFTYDAFPWVIIGYFMVRSDGKTKHALLDSFVQTPSKEGRDWVDAWNESLTLTIKKMPQLYKDRPNGWVPKCQSKKARMEIFAELFNCIEDACNKYNNVVNENALVHWGEPLKNLYEISFATLQRLIVVKPWASDMAFTSFATHLRKGSPMHLELQQLSQKIGNGSATLAVTKSTEQDPQLASASAGKSTGAVGVAASMEMRSAAENTANVKLCASALSLMKQLGAEKIKKWREKVETLEDELEKMIHANRAFDTGFVSVDSADSQTVAVIPPRLEDEDSGHSEDAHGDGTAVSGKPSGWEIAGNDGSYAECSADIAALLQKWMEEGAKQGFWVTQKSGPVQMLTRDEAMAKLGGGREAKFVYKVDFVTLKQINLGTKKERQLRPVGEQALLMRSKSPQGPLKVDASGAQSLPEYIQKALQRTKSSPFQPFNPKHVNDIVYAKAAVNHIRSKGSKVVIYIRRTDEYSSDPVGVDQDFLGQLTQEPNVSTCFVLWRPPGDQSWDAQETSKNWQSFAGDVKIKLVAMKESKDVDTLLTDVEACRQEAVDIVRDRLESKRQILNSTANKFEGEIHGFLEERTKAEHKKADWFQMYLREDVRKISSSAIKGLETELSPSKNPVVMAIPKGDFLADLPDFLPAAIDTVAKDNDNARSINELECRAFLVNILLSQTLEHAKKMAGTLYDGAFAKALDDIGKWFFMDGAILLEELESFCQAGKAENQEDLLKEFLSREHFIHMFVGCTLWNVMPMLYSLVLPTLWDRDGPTQKVSAAMYDHNLKRILEILST